MAKMKDSGTGLVAQITQISKALHRRTGEELLGMRLKQFMLLGFVRDHQGVSRRSWPSRSAVRRDGSQATRRGTPSGGGAAG